MKWIVEIDYCADSIHQGPNKPDYYTWTAKDFQEARQLSQEISSKPDVYLVSLYRFTLPLISVWGHKEPRVYIQRNGGKLHSANSEYYKRHESPGFMTGKRLADCGKWPDAPY